MTTKKSSVINGIASLAIYLIAIFFTGTAVLALSESAYATAATAAVVAVVCSLAGYQLAKVSKNK